MESFKSPILTWLEAEPNMPTLVFETALSPDGIGKAMVNFHRYFNEAKSKTSILFYKLTSSHSGLLESSIKSNKICNNAITRTLAIFSEQNKANDKSVRFLFDQTLQNIIFLLQSLLLPNFLNETSIHLMVESVTRWLVNEKIRLRNVREIQDYLAHYPDIIDIVPQAVYAAKKHLPEAQLILEVYHDPEIEDRFLVLYARFPSYDKTVMERIKKAEAEFLDRLANAEGWLQLTTDFGKLELE